MTTRVDAVTSWRAVCPKFGQAGHTKHVRSRETLEKAEVVAAANDHLYEQLAKGDGGLVSYFRSEIGWQVQAQTITEWEVVA